MTKKDVLELKRRFKKNECTFTRMCGCYVNAEKDVVLNLEETFLNLKEEEFYKYLEIAKKTLSGTIGNNLLELEFPLDEESAGGKQQFLMALKQSRLKDPELLETYLKHKDYLVIESIKQKIIDLIKKETIDANNLIDIQRSNEVLNSVPYQLLKENKKFQYGNIKKGSRSKDYEASIQFLGVNGLIHRSFKLNDIKSPLSSYKDIESFKLYPNDVGILYTMLHLNKMKFMTNDEIKRTLIENNVANTLVNLGYSLYYYQSDGKSEISFIVQNRLGEIIPIEILNMNLTKAKALSMFTAKYKVGNPIRLTEDNFSKKKNVKYIPVYASFCLRDL